MPPTANVMSDEDIPEVTRSRALMTTQDRYRIARGDDVTDERHYQAVSRVRRRVKENLADDIAVLARHHTNLLNEVRDIVCESGSNHGDNANAPELEAALDGLLAAAYYCDDRGLNALAEDAGRLYQDVAARSPHEDWDENISDRPLDDILADDRYKD